MEEASVAFRKTHDLSELLTQVIAIEPGWQGIQSDLDFLNKYSVLRRYPGGGSADKAEAKDAVSACRKIRRAARAAFGLPD